MCRRARRLPLPSLVLPALLLVAACAGEPQGVVRYEDFVTDQAQLPADAPDPRAQLPCADQTHYVRPLTPGEPISVAVAFGAEPRLVLTYCRDVDGLGELRVRATAEGTKPVATATTVDGPPSWHRLEVDLSPLADRDGEIELSVDLPPERRLLLRDAYVVQRSATAAGWPRRGVHVLGEDDGEPADTAAAPASPPAAVDGQGKIAPQILLVSIDTLRADAVGALAGVPAEESPTPHLDRLIADGELFTPHYAGASWTKPSHATLLTGFPAAVHGANGPKSTLLAGLPTLAGRLAGQGLATGGMVHNCVWLNPKFGLHRGFADYRSAKWRTGQLGRAAVNWLAAHRDRPFFFFLHTFDVHSDFYRLPYEAAGVSLWTVNQRFGVPGYGCRQGNCASGLLNALLDGRIEPIPREREILTWLYRAGVRETDDHLGRVLDDLRRLGLYDRMMIVVTSDHGEMLLEHGETLHGRIWDQVLRVPLIVKWPGGERAGRVTRVPTGAEDVAATVLAVAGVDAGDLPGRDLRRPRPDRMLVSGTPLWWAVHEGDLKAVLYMNDRQDKLFDLAADAGEEHDLAAERPQEVARLRQQLERFLRRSAATRQRYRSTGGVGERQLSAEEKERLRALGYLD